jgi:hypothetical protein
MTGEGNSAAAPPETACLPSGKTAGHPFLE